MSKLVVTEFMSLDGIVEDPGGEWVTQFDQGPKAYSFKLNETLNSECMLLGRVTYEGFARSWPDERGEFADKFNSLPKRRVLDPSRSVVDQHDRAQRRPYRTDSQPEGVHDRRRCRARERDAGPRAARQGARRRVTAHGLPHHPR